MSAGGDPLQVQLGPGRIWIAPLGTTGPASASAALDPAFWALGYTEAGTTASIALTVDGILVAEELDPIAFANSARAISFKMALAQVTRRRLAIALNMGGTFVDNAQVLDFPDAGVAPVGVCMVWDSKEVADATNERWYVPSVIQKASVDIARQKSPAKATLPLELSAVKTAALPIVRVFPSATGLV